MASFAQGKIEAYCGPAGLGAPDDLEQVIVEFIRGAKKTLDIAVQELDSEPIAQALLDAAFKGIDIRMFLEQDYLRAASPPKVAPQAQAARPEWAKEAASITAQPSRSTPWS